VEKAKPAASSKFRAAKEVSVMAWIENQFGDVLLLKQSRGNKLWTLPGGKVRMHESLLGALKREVQEETGLKIQSIVLVRVFDRAQKGVITFLYRAQIKGRKDTIVPKRNEISAGQFTSVLPKTPSPSLRFFWNHVRAESDSSQFHG
jgi:ADP-ribose pyrophosphatase YjhB (NUDIX family)